VSARYGGTSPTPEQLSRYLRTGDDPELRRRRGLVALSLVSAAMGQLVAAYQVGVLRHLPDPPGPFDADRVDASPYAFPGGLVPDGPLMVGTYAVTAALAAAGGEDRARRRPVLSLLTGAKVAVDAVTTVVLAGQEWRQNRALCAYCQVATVASLVSVPLVLPEVRRAWAARRSPGA
jgi:uncharacterized membrane protein